ncbi:hypothetical protein [Mycolicibacterium sp.]|uniref:hypothetical protein n=1 Tax=Mycolicibacterium sp. TaxID=2320850 RepID=UPI0037C6F6E0
MSLISGQIGTHERFQADKRRDWMHVKSLWSDTAAQQLLDLADELEQQDKLYGFALKELDATFDQADKLLGPI